jgi:GT2 family glycosyltransferase
VAVVPNWNGRDLLDAVLESLVAQDLDQVGVIVVDNGSDDGSLEHLARHWPAVAVFENESNLGFSPAVNRGIENSAGEFVALVNNDMRLEPQWASRLVKALEMNPNAASAACKIRMVHEPDLLDGAGDLVGWDGYAARRGQGEPDHGQYDESEMVFSACAGAAMYRRSALKRIGLFDEEFFSYMCDVDWGFRAQLAGFDCAYEPRAVAHHLGAATSGKVSGFELFLAHRNMISMMVKDFPLLALILNLPSSLARRAGSLGKAIKGRQARTLLRAWLAGMREVPRSLAARRGIQSRRVRGYRELNRLVLTRAPRRRGRAP